MADKAELSSDLHKANQEKKKKVIKCIYSHPRLLSGLHGLHADHVSRLVYWTSEAKAAHASVLAGTCSFSPFPRRTSCCNTGSQDNSWCLILLGDHLKTVISSRACSEATYSSRTALPEILCQLHLQKASFRVGICSILLSPFFLINNSLHHKVTYLVVRFARTLFWKRTKN